MLQAVLGAAVASLLGVQRPEGGALEDLVARLTASPGNLVVTTQRVNTWWRLPDEDVAACREHVRSKLGTCWSTADPADSAWVSLQSPLWTPDYEPVAIVNMKEWDWRTQYTEDLVYSGGGWRMLRQEMVDGRQLVAHAVFDGREFVRWEYWDGELQATRRQPLAAGGCSIVSYVELDLCRARSRTRSLLDLAETSEWKVKSDLELRLEVDLTSPSRLRRIVPTPPNGYTCENPGDAVLHYEIDEVGASKLDVTFYDCGDSPVFSYDLEWGPSGHYPRLFVATDHAAGPGHPTEETRLSLAVRPATAEEVASIAWNPRVGEQVIDERFGSIQSYSVNESGRLPSDETLAEAARADTVELGAGVVSALALDERGLADAASKTDGADDPTSTWAPWLLATLASVLLFGGGLTWRHLRASR